MFAMATSHIPTRLRSRSSAWPLVADYGEMKEKLRRVVSAASAGSLYDVLFAQPLSDSMAGDKYHYSVPNEDAKLLFGISIKSLSIENESSLVVVLQDLSIYEQLDEEKAYREYQKLFFAMITHELRNPLQGILGVFELLKDSAKGNEEMNKNCAIGLNTGKLMLCLIQDILDLSQLEANKFTLNDRDSFLPAEAVQECMDVMEFQFKKKGLELRKTITHVPTLQIRSDKNRYKQIILNLLGNALKFTPKGQVIIRTSYSFPLLTTTVADTGLGMSQADQTKLFQLFGKVDTHKRGNPLGVGFGLCISKRLCEAMGGSIGVKSVAGMGSEFTFAVADRTGGGTIEETVDDRAPCEAEKHPVVVESRSQCDVEARRNAVGAIIVDDEEICGFVLQRLIKSCGYSAELVLFSI